MSAARARVSLGILAGGQGTRLGGADKATLRFQGATLAQRTLAALGGGFAQTLMSYNGNATLALPLGMRVLPDRRPGFPGPLAGIESLLGVAEGDWLLTVPVDLATLPSDLVERLLECAHAGEGVAAVDADGAQPLVALWPVASSRAAVGAALDGGERAVHRVQRILGFGACEFAPLAFGNLNTPADFDRVG